MDIVCAPEWWRENGGISFDRDFFFHPARRVEDERKMERLLYERWGRFDEMYGPYATVIDIDPEKLPTPAQADAWDAREFAAALRHDRACDRYNRDFRQLLHVGYKVAAEMGDRYTDALKANREIVAANVTENIYARHIRPVFYP